MRVAVIGCGVIGAAVGWHLARGDAEVVLIDGGAPGTGVTNWSVGWVNASNKTASREYFDLNAASMAAYRSLVDELGAGEWWHPTGHLRWFDDPAQARQLRDETELLRSWHYPVELVAAQTLFASEPGVVYPSGETEVATCAAEGWIDGRELVDRLLDDAMDHGAETLIGRAVSDVIIDNERVVAVMLAGGRHLSVDAVVNAAGPAGAEVAATIGRTLPLREEPGLVARLTCDSVPISRILHAPRVELRPDGPHRVMLHSRLIDALITGDTVAADLAGRLVELAVGVVPALADAELLEAQVARRPIPIDGFPSLGGIGGLRGYYEAVTHSGITLAPIVGRLLADEILSGTVDPLAAPYRPDRFGGGVGS